MLPRDPHADLPTVEAVRGRSAAADALIAVGSGTINDVTKYAAACDAKPYAVFATAPDAVLQVGTEGAAVIRLNGTEVGRHGGFDPYAPGWMFPIW